MNSPSFRTMSARVILSFAALANSMPAYSMGGEGIVGNIISFIFALYFWAIVFGLLAFLSIRKRRPSLATKPFKIAVIGVALIALPSSSLFGALGLLLGVSLFVPIASAGLVMAWLYLQTTSDRVKLHNPYSSDSAASPLHRLGEHDNG